MILPVSNPGKTRLNCRNQFQLKYGLASRLPTLSGRTIGTVIFSNGNVGTDCLHVAHGIADFSNREADKRREVPFLERKASSAFLLVLLLAAAGVVSLEPRMPTAACKAGRGSWLRILYALDQFSTEPV